MAFQSSLCSFFLSERSRVRSIVVSFARGLFSNESRQRTDRSINDRKIEGCSIFGNSIAWQKRVLFSQEAGDMVFSLQTIIMSITPVGCCIEGGTEAQP